MLVGARRLLDALPVPLVIIARTVKKVEDVVECAQVV